jgi:hypothetical protein
LETVKEPIKTQQILCHEIEPNSSKDRAMHEGDNPSFGDEFITFTFFSVLSVPLILQQCRLLSRPAILTLVWYPSSALMDHFVPKRNDPWVVGVGTRVIKMANLLAVDVVAE